MNNEQEDLIQLSQEKILQKKEDRFIICDPKT